MRVEFDKRTRFVGSLSDILNLKKAAILRASE